MKVRCIHGYFIIEEQGLGEVSDFISATGLSVVPVDNYYTFEFLADAPSYSLKGKSLLNLVSTKTFEGKPWEVFKQNGVVYDFNKGLLVPIASVTQTTKIYTSGFFYFAPGLILPGSLTDDGQRVKDYAAYFSPNTSITKYSEVAYV